MRWLNQRTKLRAPDSILLCPFLASHPSKRHRRSLHAHHGPSNDDILESKIDLDFILEEENTHRSGVIALIYQIHR